MIWLALLLFLVVPIVSVRALMPVTAKAAKRRGGGAGRLYTFLVDPLTLLVVVLVSTLLFLVKGKGKRLTRRQFQKRKLALDLWLFGFLGFFWTLQVLTYFNVMGHPFDPSKTGNDFMWNGYVDMVIGSVVDTSIPTFRSVPMTMLAVVLMMLQLPCLLLGRRLGFMTAFFNDLDNWSRPRK